MNEEQERQAFENWVKAGWPQPGMNTAKYIKTLSMDNGEYSCPGARLAWAVWKKRAELEEGK